MLQFCWLFPCLGSTIQQLVLMMILLLWKLLVSSLLWSVSSNSIKPTILSVSISIKPAIISVTISIKSTIISKTISIKPTNISVTIIIKPTIISKTISIKPTYLENLFLGALSANFPFLFSKINCIFSPLLFVLAQLLISSTILPALFPLSLFIFLIPVFRISNKYVNLKERKENLMGKHPS